MTFVKIASGKPVTIAAKNFNELVDAVHANKAREAAQLVGQLPAAATPQPLAQRVARVLNDTGQHLNQYSVVGLGVPQAMPAEDEGSFLDRVILRGVMPDAAQHLGRFAVILHSAPTDSIVAAVVAGLAVARVDDGGVVAGNRAEIVDGHTGYLQLLAHGSATVLWRLQEAGQQLAVIRLGAAPPVFPVQMAMVGGSQGDHNSPATWTYDVKDMDGRVLLRGVNPALSPHRVNRQAWGSINAAQFGLAAYAGGQLVVLWCNEIWEPDIHPDARLYEGVLRNP